MNIRFRNIFCWADSVWFLLTLPFYRAICCIKTINWLALLDLHFGVCKNSPVLTRWHFDNWTEGGVSHCLHKWFKTVRNFSFKPDFVGRVVGNEYKNGLMCHLKLYFCNWKSFYQKLNLILSTIAFGCICAPSSASGWQTSDDLLEPVLINISIKAIA